MGSLGVLYGTVGLPGIALIGLAPLTATVLGLDAENVRLLLALALAGLWYLAVLRRRLRDGTAGIGTARPDPVEIG